jgi:hypothetical protein
VHIVLFRLLQRVISWQVIEATLIWCQRSNAAQREK